VISFLADIYRNAPNPILRDSSGYVLFLVIFIIISGVVLGAIIRKNPKSSDTGEAERREAEEERLRDLHIEVASTERSARVKIVKDAKGTK